MTAAEADGKSISLLDLVRENARKFDEICCAGLAVTERCRTAMQLHVERTLSEMGPEGLAKFAETLFPVEPYKPPRMLWPIRRQLMLHLGIIDKSPCPKAVLPPRSPSHRGQETRPPPRANERACRLGSAVGPNARRAAVPAAAHPQGHREI